MVARAADTEYAEDEVTLEHGALLTLLGARHAGPVPAAPYRSVSADDRAPGEGLFVVIQGRRHDPTRLLTLLPAEGVCGVVGEAEPPAGLGVPYYRVLSARRALALLEQRFAGDPGRWLRIIGITGTNGKSTTVRLCAAMLAAAGRPTGWWGTVDHGHCGGAARGPSVTPSALTTPEPHALAAHLRALVAAGCTDAVLEVSSHALVQERLAGLELAGAAFTNLSRDHYDYHGTPEAYLEAKLRLFAQTTPAAPAVVPHAGPVPLGSASLRNARVLTFGDDARADAFPEHVQLTAAGLSGTLRVLGERVALHAALIGRHNLLNVLAAALLARALATPIAAIEQALAGITPVPGRLEVVPGSGGRVFVDYAHTPDALRAVLEAVREVAPGKLRVVFGCGGDRDPGKRPVMGAIAERLADRVVITSDNPRSEDPTAIVEQIRAGFAHPERALVEIDRRAAITLALADLAPGELLVVAGKGHEREQKIGDRVLPFDDRVVVQEWFAREGGVRAR